MKEVIKLSAALGIICAIASALLGFANMKTAAARKAASIRQKLQALEQVLPKFDNQPLQDVSRCKVKMGDSTRTVTFYRARKDGKIIAVAGEGMSPKGFGGELRVLVGLNPDGRILAVVVTANKETPGLGSTITDRKQQKTLAGFFHPGKKKNGEAKLTPNHYLDVYTGRVCRRDTTFVVNKDGGDIDAVSGATISSRAVADAVTAVARAFGAGRSDILETK